MSPFYLAFFSYLNDDRGFSRNKRIREYDVGHDTVHVVRANPIEEAVLVGASSDRSVFVLDTRQATPLRKVGQHHISLLDRLAWTLFR